MLSLCCSFIEFNKSVERTLQSFKRFIEKAKELNPNFKCHIIAITSNKLDINNKNLLLIIDSIEYITPKGVYSAYNSAIKKSFSINADWIWILGGGDTLFYPNKTLINNLSDKGFKKKIITGDIIIGDRKKINKRKTPSIYLFSNLDKMRLNHPGMIIPSFVYKQIGLYNEKEKIISDYEWCIKAFKENIKFIKTQDLLTYHELGGVSTKVNISNLFIHVKSIKILFKNFGISPITLFALVLRPLRFLFSRFIYYLKKIGHL